MSYLQILGLVVVIFLCTFVVVDRVCKSFEQCITMKAFKKYMENAEKKHNFDEKIG